MKTSLGIWALGRWSTRFVPGGYQPQWRDETTAQRVRRAVDGLGDLIDDYEFHYPQELSARTSTRCATRSAGTASTASRPASTSIRSSAAAASARPTRRSASEAVGGRWRPPTSPASSAPTSSSGRDRGLQLPVPDPVPRELGAVRRRHRPGRPALHGARGPALPRAQELRAGDEDPHAQRRHDAARHPQLRAQGLDNVKVNMDWQHLIMNGESLGRVRGAARGRGAARPPARQLRVGHLRRRQHGRGDRVHGDARARARAPARRLRRQRRAARLRPLPVHGGRRRGGAPQRAPVAFHRGSRGRGSTSRRSARRRRRRTRFAPTSSSTPPSAP